MFRGSFINSAAESVKDTDKRKNMNRMKQTKQNHFIKIKKKKRSQDFTQQQKLVTRFLSHYLLLQI